MYQSGLLEILENVSGIFLGDCHSLMLANVLLVSNYLELLSWTIWVGKRM